MKKRSADSLIELFFHMISFHSKFLIAIKLVLFQSDVLTILLNHESTGFSSTSITITESPWSAFTSWNLVKVFSTKLFGIYQTWSDYSLSTSLVYSIPILTLTFCWFEIALIQLKPFSSQICSQNHHFSQIVFMLMMSEILLITI